MAGQLSHKMTWEKDFDVIFLGIKGNCVGSND